MRLGAALAGLAALAACASATPEPSRADAYADFLVARLANLRGDHGAAADRYFRALESNPDDERLLGEAVSAALAAGDLDRARFAAAKAHARHADVAFAALIVSADALAEGRLRAARGALVRVNGATAEEQIEALLGAWARVGEHRHDLAGAELERLNSAAPYVGIQLYARAMAADYRNDAAAAAEAYARAAQTGVWLAPAVVRNADFAFRQGHNEAAAAMLQVAAARIDSAEIDAALARLEAGQRPATTALTPARGAAIGLYGLGALALADADMLVGLQALSLSLMLDADLDAARLAFADAQYSLGNIDAADASLAGLAPGSPYGASAGLSKAWSLIEEGQTQAALARAQESAAAAQTPWTQRKLAQLYASLGRDSAAAALFDTLIDTRSPEAPPDWRLHFARAAARDRLGRWPEAEADLLRALEIAPDRPEVLNYLGYTWVDRGPRVHEGKALIERALLARPNSAAIIDSLGWAHFRLGDYPAAVAALERAVELEPGDALLNEHLGDAYWRVGRRIEARYQWRRSLVYAQREDVRAGIEVKLETGLSPLAATAAATR